MQESQGIFLAISTILKNIKLKVAIYSYKQNSMVLITSKILYIRITVLLDTTFIVYCIFSEKCGHVLTIVNKLSGLVSKQ